MIGDTDPIRPHATPATIVIPLRACARSHRVIPTRTARGWQERRGAPRRSCPWLAVAETGVLGAVAQKLDRLTDTNTIRMRAVSIVAPRASVSPTSAAVKNSSGGLPAPARWLRRPAAGSTFLL